MHSGLVSPSAHLQFGLLATGTAPAEQEEQRPREQEEHRGEQALTTHWPFTKELPLAHPQPEPVTTIELCTQVVQVEEEVQDKQLEPQAIEQSIPE